MRHQPVGSHLLLFAMLAGFASKLIEKFPSPAPNVDRSSSLVTGGSERGDNFASDTLREVEQASVGGLQALLLIGVVRFRSAGIAGPAASCCSIGQH